MTKDGRESGRFNIMESIIFGRNKDCDIKITNKTVSKVHCKIAIDQNGHCCLMTISQTNPTSLNGQPITHKDDPVVLRDKDLFMFLIFCVT